MKGQVMTPEEEQMTIEDAFQRITAALGSDRGVDVRRSPGYRRWTTTCVVHCGRDVDGQRVDGHVITIHHDQLGAALAELTRECQLHATKVLALLGGAPISDATAADHAQAAALEEPRS